MRSGTETSAPSGSSFHENRLSLNPGLAPYLAVGSTFLAQWQIQWASYYTLLTLSCFTQEWSNQSHLTQLLLELNYIMPESAQLSAGFMHFSLSNFMHTTTTSIIINLKKIAMHTSRSCYRTIPLLEERPSMARPGVPFHLESHVVVPAQDPHHIAVSIVLAASRD